MDGVAVTSIGSYAFDNCCSMTAVTIPDSVTSIGNWTFENCNSLSAVTIPGSITSIGSDAFDNCSDMLTMTVDRDSYALQYCKDNGIKYIYPDTYD